jgi:hypothetical protein
MYAEKWAIDNRIEERVLYSRDPSPQVIEGLQKVQG